MRHYEIVVIGSGINSLTAAATLARAGRQVIVLEKNNWFGGSILTDETSFPGFAVDLLAGFQPLFVTGPAYADWEAELSKAGLRYCNTPIPTATLRPDGRSVVFYSDRAQTIEELNRIEPGDGDRYDAVMTEFDERYAGFTQTLLNHDLAGIDLLKAGGMGAFTLGPTGLLEFAGRALTPARYWLDANLRSDLSRALFAPWPLHNGLSPDDTASALILQVIFNMLGKVGMPAPEGGGSRMVDAWTSIIRNYGGELVLNANVDQILVQNNRATGVVVGGETILADYVLANVTPTQLYRQLIDPENIPVGIRRQAREYRYGRGNLQLLLTLDSPPNWPDARLKEAAVVNLTSGVDGISRAVNEALRGYLPAEPTIILGQHMALDPSRGPAGAWTVWIQLLDTPSIDLRGDAAGRPPAGIDVTGGWTDAVKEAYADRVIDQIDRVCPGFRQSITNCRVISPKELADLNPNLVGGDPYSGACTLDQFTLWRPFKSMLPHQTPFRNLYHIGASTHPGPGLSGTSGYLVAKKIG